MCAYKMSLLHINKSLDTSTPTQTLTLSRGSNGFVPFTAAPSRGQRALNYNPITNPYDSSSMTRTVKVVEPKMIGGTPQGWVDDFTEGTTGGRSPIKLGTFADIHGWTKERTRLQYWTTATC